MSEQQARHKNKVAHPAGVLPNASARFFPRLFLAVLVVMLVRTAFAILWQKYVVLPNLFPASSQGLQRALEFVSSGGSFLISPVLLFFVTYKLGKGLDLGSTWRPIAGSVFLGGVVATLLGFVFGVAIYSGGDLSSIATTLGLEFGDGWNIVTLVISCVDEGLFAIFVAVTAVFYAGHRTKDSGLGTSEGGGAGASGNDGPDPGEPHGGGDLGPSAASLA